MSENDDPTREDSGTTAVSEKPVRHVQVKAWHIIFLIIVVLATIGLAWWQWTRFQSGSGTFQNLGYALQWPLFGAFAVYAYRMGVKYENEARDAQRDTDDPDFIYEADLKEFGESVTEIDEDFLPRRPQIDIDEYNELNTPRRGVNSRTGREQTAEQISRTEQKDDFPTPP